MNLLQKWNPFRKRRIEFLQSGLLRSTDPSEKAHDHFQHGMLDISNNMLVSEAERSRLRAWCKKEYLDNPYARNAARNFALGVYGVGPKLQISTQDEVRNNRLENKFRKWRKKSQLDQKILVALQSLFYDGEAFFLLYDSPGMPNNVGIELIEARRVRDPYGASVDENRMDGITYNFCNEPVCYSVVRESINSRKGNMEEYVTIPADSMVHLFVDDVVNQRRGLPMLQSVLETMASLQRISRASLNAWELAAKMNLVIQTDLAAYDFLRCLPKNSDPEDANCMEAFKTVPVPKDGGMTFLASGMNMQQVRAEHPTSQFAESKDAFLKEVGAGVGEPRNIITNDSSAYNFSSAQIDDQMFRRFGAAVQNQIIRVLDHCLEELMEAAAADGDRDATAMLLEYGHDDIPAEWHFATIFAELDRVHNASADVQLLQAGLMTRKEYCKRYGLDYEQHESQRRAEKEESAGKELGKPNDASAIDQALDVQAGSTRKEGP